MDCVGVLNSPLPSVLTDLSIHISLYVVTSLFANPQVHVRWMDGAAFNLYHTFLNALPEVCVCTFNSGRVFDWAIINILIVFAIGTIPTRPSMENIYVHF